ncbi:MAG TPA: VOC family protein [Candidatus Solibacter sp.]|nr:VOC family protein [Candidatus Solibacter sp.]
MTISGIDHVQIAAPSGCEEEARRFYGGLLGLTELPNPEVLRSRGGVWFKVGDQELHVGVAESFAPAQKAHPAFAVHAEDLTALAESLTQALAVVTWDEAIPGVRRFYVADPWGNRLEFVGKGSRSDSHDQRRD